MTKPKPPHLKLKPGPKPGTARRPKAAAPAAQVALAAAAGVETVSTPAPPRSHDALQRGRDIKTMPEAELRQYARQVGISARDAAELAVDRLRANCVLMVHQFIEQF